MYPVGTAPEGNPKEIEIRRSPKIGEVSISLNGSQEGFIPHLLTQPARCDAGTVEFMGRDFSHEELEQPNPCDPKIILR